ncbi:MAG: glucuronate isomerase [Rikenellaceae bacterium]|jgi:glucuronate isomerase|nr:glucuronate isomerase [Rikenellaceae bacterium]
MKPFIDDDFMLEGGFAQKLYHEHAAAMPIIDYHNHLSPKMIAEDYRFSTITELWLAGDHYKWRALRANGVDERYITGDASDKEKFTKWAETIPYTMRNPLYHWTHLELKRYFGIDTLLNPATAEEIYEQCNRMLAQDGFSVRGLLAKMNVEVLCTTDDPVDKLLYHKQIAKSGFLTKVLPTWRPDKILAVDDTVAYNGYIDQLATVSDTPIANLSSLLSALKVRLNYFATMGCHLSDHGFNSFPNATFTDEQVDAIVKKLRSGGEVTPAEAETYRAGMLYHLLRMNAEMGWAQQLHIGAIRNNNLRLFKKLGADVGCDSIADGAVAEGLSKTLGRLDEDGVLAKTIVYNLNPKDSEVLLSMVYNFNDGTAVGKMQYGAAWWFLDQLDGMTKQLGALSNLGLLGRFVGMLTDSRSFVSFPRHEYFRRLLCNTLGQDLEKGLLPPSEIDFIGRMVEDISYRNAKTYFRF